MPRQRVSPDLFEDENAGIGRRLLGLCGQAVSAHPSLAGGSVAFAVIFGFVAANALWHQPGRHPAPILKTREVASAATPLAALRPETEAGETRFVNGVPARSVTTYRIERSDDTPTASIPVPNTPPVVASPDIAAPGRGVESTQAGSAADPVLSQIQTILARNGLYSGEIDGLMGPKSAAAIRDWEKDNGYSQTGEATAALLAIMMEAKSQPAPVDVVSRMISNSEPATAGAPRTGQPVTVPAESDLQAGPSELVRQIQAGLSNIAYADISIDGVAGAQTRTAISAFEKHYRLPVTGQPNETVLNKLVEIGAL
ncbi:peptidoglycan-binding domain-containing protein [Hoeflea sp. YIM 152468]|uniref:peptidoglycan-binding domain-containing protein n=1 Tax=Hoeflea sp. YIM 152468 TaxID=3031759 RepID=UPI0023D9B29C|nr:peptidoglycan-binding domain-containing protein [Hoeflea sp. YIM 152468]MDF1607295.1 peptidoglycan-binding domain-containing protein [Hoeflea sp. YIM 152468]